jgi:hypothetical protein
VAYFPVPGAEENINGPAHPKSVNLIRTVEYEPLPRFEVGRADQALAALGSANRPARTIRKDVAFTGNDSCRHALVGYGLAGWLSAKIAIHTEVTDMQKWEYATVPLISHALQEILNQWGEEGWELVQVIESQATGTTAFLKRPKT